MAGTQKSPTMAQGNIYELQKKGLRLGGSLLNYGFIGLDSALRIKDGESAPVALGKALLTNAAFSLLPGGLPTMLGLMAVQAAPEIMNQLDVAAGAINAKKRQFGGNFQETESQLTMLQQGLTKMQNARMQAARVMANHARGAQKVY